MAEDRQRAGCAYSNIGEDAVKIVYSGYRFPVHCNDEIAFAHSGAMSWAFFFTGDDDDSGFFGEIVEADDAAVDRDGLGGDADEAAANASVAEEAAGNEFGRVDADSETDTLRGKNGGGVDADDAAGGIDERATGVARVEGGVGLNDIVNKTARI